MSYRVFTRTWWRNADASERGRWPNNLIPCPGRKTTLARVQDEAEARAICARYNATHKPGRLSRKAEYESV